MKIIEYKNKIEYTLTNRISAERNTNSETSQGFVDGLTHITKLAGKLLTDDEAKYGSELNVSEYNGLQVTLSKEFKSADNVCPENSRYAEGWKNAAAYAKAVCEAIFSGKRNFNKDI